MVLTGVNIGLYRDGTRAAGRRDPRRRRGAPASSACGCRRSRSTTSTRRRWSPRWPRRPPRCRTCTCRCSRATTACCAPCAGAPPPRRYAERIAAARRGDRRPERHRRRDRRLPRRGRRRRSPAPSTWCASTGLTRVHAFPYSPRPGTRTGARRPGAAGRSSASAPHGCARVADAPGPSAGGRRASASTRRACWSSASDGTAWRAATLATTRRGGCGRRARCRVRSCRPSPSRRTTRDSWRGAWREPHRAGRADRLAARKARDADRVTALGGLLAALQEAAVQARGDAVRAGRDRPAAARAQAPRRGAPPASARAAARTTPARRRPRRR